MTNKFSISLLFILLWLFISLEACDPYPSGTDGGLVTADDSLPSVPAIRNSGNVKLVALVEDPSYHLAFFDLDNPDSISGDNSDIRLGMTRGSMTFIIIRPINGALGHPMGEDTPNYKMCQEELRQFTNGIMPEVFTGSYICILTNEGYLAQLLINYVSDINDNQVSVGFSYIVWDIVVEGDP